MHGVHDLRPAGDRADRQAAADRLRGRDDVGHDVLVLDRVPAAGRPIADWISSAMNTMPFAAQKSAMPFTNPGDGTMNPPSPWIGSMITAAMFSSPMCLCISSIA